MHLRKYEIPNYVTTNVAGALPAPAPIAAHPMDRIAQEECVRNPFALQGET
jgi:hypothetical protein